MTPHARDLIARRKDDPDPAADLPQGPRHEGGRRGRAGRGLSQRPRRRKSAPPATATRRGRLTVHLAREFGFCYGVDRAVDYAYQAVARFPGTQRLPDRRDHPQPARQRRPARSRASASSAIPRSAAAISARATSSSSRPSASPSSEMARLLGPRLHAGRHDLRLGAERLEERRPLRAGRLHRDHPRQGPARGNAGDRVAGAEVSAAAATSSCSIATKRRWSATTSATAAIAPGVPRPLRAGDLARLRSRRRSGARRLCQPDDDADVGVAGDRRDAPRGDARPLRRRPTSGGTSAPSTRSAARRRSARTRSRRCSTPSRSI